MKRKQQPNGDDDHHHHDNDDEDSHDHEDMEDDEADDHRSLCTLSTTTTTARSPEPSVMEEQLTVPKSRPFSNPSRKRRQTADRRLAHIQSEQKRRNHINDGFNELRQIIPFCSDTNDSKSSTLRKGNLVLHDVV
jgi:hypothetical protein